MVRISGRFKGKRTKLTRVTVNAPRGARIRINCIRKGRGCPYKRKATAVKLVRFRSLQRTYRPKDDARDPRHRAEEDRQVHAAQDAPRQGATAS